MNDNIPAQVFPLAEYLCEEMAARGWTTDEVAVRMGNRRGAAVDLLCLDLLLCVYDDKLIIDDETFDGLARAFDVSPELFRNLDAAWRRYPDRRSPFEPPESIFGPASRRGMMRVVTDGDR